MEKKLRQPEPVTPQAKPPVAPAQTQHPDFIVLDSVYGRFIVNRYCAGHAQSLVSTGKTHIEAELNNIRAILKTLPNDCLIVDGGANIGFVAVPAALAVREKRGIIHAFEPQRMMANALCGTIALNSFDNIYVHNCALGSAPGRLFLPKIDYGKPADFGMVSLSEKQQGEGVDVVTLDSRDLPRCDFFKLDVEGFEVPALLGARKTIEKFEPWCWIEYWMTGQENIMKCFSGLKYRFFQMDKLNMLCAPESRLKGSDISTNAPEIGVSIAPAVPKD